MALFGGTLLYDAFVLSASLLFAAYAYVVYKRNKWTRTGVPVSDAVPLLGNMKDVILGKKTLGEHVRDFYLANKDKPFVTFFAFTQPMVMVNNMELVKSILIKDFQLFADRNVGSSVKDTIQHLNMFNAKGKYWRDLRTKLSPTFTSGKMKRMFELVDICGQGFVSHLEREMDSTGVIEVKEASARYTSDVITTTAFGLDGDAMTNEDSTFRKIMKMSVTFNPLEALEAFFAFLFPWVIEKFNVQLTKPEVASFCRKTVWDTVQYREKNNVRRNDFLDLLMQLRKKGHLEDDDDDDDGGKRQENGHAGSSPVEKSKFDLDGDALVAQCVLFMAAGFETSSTTMSWALYEMALQPEIQQRVYDEITEVLAKHGGKVTYDAIQEMSYLHMLVQETLRKYPVLSFLDRQALQPYKLPGTDIRLQRGQGVMIPVLGLHWDPELYPEPERFDPQRFEPSVQAQRPSCSFLGFGDGPRNCIGMRMGWMQTKVGLVYLLKNFSVTTCEKTAIPIVYDKVTIIHSAKGGITLRLQKRAQS